MGLLLYVMHKQARQLLDRFTLAVYNFRNYWTCPHGQLLLMTYLIDPKNPLPRYYQVYQSLKKRIEDGEFAPDSALPPERQLVVDYGVSRITIVKALDTLENEGLIRREHGRGTFVNAPLGTEEDGDSVPTIAFMCGVMFHPYIYSVLMGAARVASELGYNLNVIGLNDDTLNTNYAMRQVTAQNTVGVLTYPRPHYQDLKIHQDITENDIPLVMIDRYYEEIESDYVIFEEESAAYELTRYLIDRGHKDIAFLTHYEVEATSIHNRIRGYRRAMEEADLYRDDRLWFDIYSNLHVSKGQIGDQRNTNMLRERLQTNPVTAMVAVNHDVAERLNYDLMSINMTDAQAALGTENGRSYSELTVDVAAFAYHDLKDSTAYTVITGLQAGEALGTKAARLLIDRIEGNASTDVVHLHVPIEILPDAEAEDINPASADNRLSE